MKLFERGSEWRRWDLHLHTASSYDYEYKAEDCDEILSQKLKENNIAAVAITDHFVIDKNRINHLRELAPDTVFFPGVELRTDKGDTNIHVILIFSDQTNLDELVEDFNVFKREAKENSNDEKIYWDYNSQILPFAQKHNALISIHAGRKTNGVDEKISNSLPHNQAVKSDYATTISIFEMGQVRDINQYNEKVIPNIGSKPMVICSDNHDARNYNPTNKLWIKADVTFNGLKQILYEPEERVCVSDTKPECKPDYYVIDKVILNDDEFLSEPIYFNDKLTCIIGGKSTGKSILLHNMAKAIDKIQVQEKESIVNTSTKELSNTTVCWADGQKDGDRHIIYIPQSYLNCLSDKREVTTEIDNMIQSVILNNENAKIAYEKMLTSIKEKRSELNVKILNLLDIHKETVEIDEEKKELGDRSGIEREIKKLQEQKDAISKDLELSVEDIAKYETALTESSNKAKLLTKVKQEILALGNITTIVVPVAVSLEDFSEETLIKIDDIKSQIVEEADKIWITKREILVNELINRQQQLHEEKEGYDAVVKELQPKIQGNKAIAEFSSKILAEKDKLATFNALDEKLKIKKSEEQAMITEIYSIPFQIKELRNEYANVINNEVAFKGHEIEFKVEVPFKKEEFLKTLETDFVIKIVKFKETIKMDSFREEDYTTEKLREIIDKLLSGVLEIKTGHTIESVLRDINDDWYNIKYKVVMDNDNIDVMSPGKKALVLLKLLIDLAESKCPILIDQPEDDLDNRSVFDELIPFIRRKKKERQIIVVTHNANVVLGADAEEIIIANQTGSKSENKEKRFEYRSGAIENDIPVFATDGSIEAGILNSKGIQQHICDILEGGEIAFEKRKNKYRI